MTKKYVTRWTGSGFYGRNRRVLPWRMLVLGIFQRNNSKWNYDAVGMDMLQSNHTTGFTSR
jgi:hypothetical protein